MHTVKRSFVGNIIDQQNAHSTSVVCRCDRSESLLPRSIPYLQFDSLTVQLDGTDLEVDANGGDE